MSTDWRRKPRSLDAAKAESGGFSGELPGFRSAASGLQEVVTPAAKTPWPATLPEQVAAVARVLAAASIPLPEAAIAAHFSGKGAWKKRLPQLLETLVALGRARVLAGGYVSE